MKKIGFIGLGIMGLPMAGHLMDAGYEMHIYARHPEKVTSLVEKGATLHSTIHDCVKDVDAVMTIVGFPQDVEEVYFNDNNILDSVKEGTYLIDMTTTSPTLDQRIYEEGKKRNLHVLDAPVTGGDTGAKNATLSILVGGDKEDYEACLATVYKGNIIKNLIMDCQSYAKYRPNETTGGIFVSWRRKEELPTGA